MSENNPTESPYAGDQRVVAPPSPIESLAPGHVGVKFAHPSGWSFSAAIPRERFREFADQIVDDHENSSGAFSTSLGEFMERLSTSVKTLLSQIQKPSNNLIYAIGSSENGDRSITVFNGNTLNLSAAMAAELARQLVEPPADVPEGAVVDEISIPESGQVGSSPGITSQPS